MEAEIPRSAAIACSKEGALREYLLGLRARRGELRLCLGDVKTRGDTRAMTLFRDLECAVEGGDGIVENGILAIETAQLHVIIDQLRKQ